MIGLARVTEGKLNEIESPETEIDWLKYRDRKLHE